MLHRRFAPTRRALLAGLAATAALPAAAQQAGTLLNVSYDPTRELYREYNQAFAARWRAQTGQALRVTRDHRPDDADEKACVGGGGDVGQGDASRECWRWWRRGLTGCGAAWPKGLLEALACRPASCTWSWAQMALKRHPGPGQDPASETRPAYGERPGS